MKSRKELKEEFCKALNEANLGPFEETVYSDMVFIDEVKEKEINLLIQELKRLS